ncbi:MAG: phosphate ABC transporter substrate-binding protein PstS, partial [Elusimicrobiota bacterium]
QDFLDVGVADAAGDDAYPIATFTWLLVYESNGGDEGRIIKEFLRWMLADGQKLAAQLGYAPLPLTVAQSVGKTIETIK